MDLLVLNDCNMKGKLYYCLIGFLNVRGSVCLVCACFVSSSELVLQFESRGFILIVLSDENPRCLSPLFSFAI